MNIKASIIHLERSAARYPQVQQLARAIPLPTRVLPAVDGRQLDDATVSRHYRRHIHAPRYPFTLLATEIGCFLSYRRAWQAILDEGLDAGLIAEDDVAVASPRFAELVERVAAVIRPDEYVRFPLHERGEGKIPPSADGSVAMIEPWLPGLGMQMQMVGREAARRLLSASEVFDRPVDSLVQMQWLHGARVLSARPVIIQEVDFAVGGSVIQIKNGGLVHKVVHEVSRPILRLAVRAANDRWRHRRAA